MGAVLILADSRSPEMRHEVPVVIPDAFLYVESDGRRVAVVSAFEVPRIEAANAGIEPLPPEKLGMDELLAGGMPAALADLEVYARACEELGITDASVPAAFPLELADHLRANGVEVTVERELFEDRRRSKTATEIAGLRRAQRACEAALDVARELLRGVADEPVTCERIKQEIERVFSAHGVTGDEFIVSHGAQAAIGHELGSGPIAPGEAVVIDLFPRDRDDRHVLRHDPHLRRRRGSGRAPRVPPALQGGAGAVDGGGAARRERPRPDAAGLRPLRRRTAIRRR